MAAAAHKKAPVAGGEPFDPMKYVDKGVKMLQNVIESEMTQLRAPLVLGAGVGRLGFSVAWMFIFVEFAIQIYNIQRASRLPRPHKKEVKNKFERPSDPVPQEKPEDGSEKATWRKVLIGVEMYFHLIVGLLVAFYIGSFHLDLLMLLPVVEIVVFIEKQLLLLRLKVTGTHSTVPELDVKEDEVDVVIEDFESFKAMLSTTPIHVDTEWMNMLLAQFWQLYATWSEEFVRSQLEFYTNGLGLKTENSTLGKIPITLKNVTGKRRRVFVGSSEDVRSDEDLIYDLDLHVEWAATPCIQLSIAGIKLTVNSLFLSGVLRAELKWFEIDEREGDFLTANFPNLTGITIYFTERPSLSLSLSVMGLFDLLSLPILDWIVQKVVVDSILCGMMGPSGDKITPFPLYDFKDDMIATRDRARGTGGDIDIVSKKFRPCQLIVTVVNAVDVPRMDGSLGLCDPYCKLKYGVRASQQWLAEEQKTKHIAQSLDPFWNEKFEWFTSSDEDELEITMFDFDQVGADDEIGKWQTTLGDLRRELKLHLKKVPVPHVVYLDTEGRHQPAPKLTLQIQFRNYTAHIEGCEDGTMLKDVEILKDVGGILRVSLRRCQFLPRGDDDIFVVFYVGKKDQYKENNDSKLIWDQEDKPLRCEWIKSKELSVLSKKGLMTEKSGVVQNNSNPEWSPGDAEWEFELKGSADEYIVSAVVFDQDAVMDQLLGSAVFELKGLNASNKGARFLTPDEEGKRPIFMQDGSKLVDQDAAPSTITFICDFLPDEAQVEEKKNKNKSPAEREAEMPEESLPGSATGTPRERRRSILSPGRRKSVTGPTPAKME